MAELRNFIPDHNRFKLAAPPQWWLQKLHDFDDSLVVVPSRQGCYYRLAQRRPLQLRENIVNDALFKESDTRMLASYSLVPVTTIIANPVWSEWMFKELEERAPWRQGGAEKVIKRIEEHELDKELKARRATSENLAYRAKDGWKSYQARTGQRTFVDSTRAFKSRPMSGGSPMADRRPRQSAPGPIVLTDM